MIDRRRAVLNSRLMSSVASTTRRIIDLCFLFFLAGFLLGGNTQRLVTGWFLRSDFTQFFLIFDLLQRKVNWVIRSNGSDLIVVVGVNAWQPFDVFEGLSSKVKVEFSA